MAASTASLTVLACVATIAVYTLWDGGSLFSLHTLAMTSSCFLCLAAVALFLPGNAQYHALLQIGNLIACTVGFLAIFINKHNLGKPHFYESGSSWHALLGAVVFTLIGLISLEALWKWGTPSTYSQYSLRDRRTHAARGAITVGLLVFNTVIGWFKVYTKSDRLPVFWVLSFSTIAVALVLVRKRLQRPNIIKELVGH